jgi:RimJ/RimL family protein N-acetyltransferase
VSSPKEKVELPQLRLRAVGASDGAFIEKMRTPEVEGEWDTYDDAPNEKLSGAHYNGDREIIELPDGTPIGSVSWIQTPHGPNTRSLAWVIGIVLLPQHRGHGFGAVAQRLLAEKLLDGSRANRVEASTDVHNLSEQRSLSLAGFTNEGIRRGALWRAGAWHDQVIFSRLRSD